MHLSDGSASSVLKGPPLVTGISFLRPMPDRSCSEIGIPATRCSCATFAREDVNNLVSAPLRTYPPVCWTDHLCQIWNSISHDLVGSLNEKTKPFPECLTLMTSKIKEVQHRTVRVVCLGR